MPLTELGRRGAPPDDRGAGLPAVAHLHTLRQTWPLLALTPVMLALVAIGLMVQGVGQIVSSNASRWERAQQSAVLDLARYSDSCAPRHFEAYLREMQTLKAFEGARSALLTGTPDRAEAFDGYLRIGLPQWEAHLLVATQPLLQSLPLNQSVNAIAREANSVAHEIDAYAMQLHAVATRGCGDQQAREALLAQVYRATQRMGPLRRAMDAAASDARWRLSAAVLAAMALLAFPITAAGYSLTSRLQRRAAAASLALAHSEHRLQRALSGSGYGLWDLQPHIGELWCSGTMMSLLGYEDHFQVLAYEDVLARVHPQDRQPLERLLRERFADGARFEAEIRLHRRDGRPRWFKLAGQAAPIGDAGPQHMIGSISDVTERREVQAALEHELAMRRAALDSLRYALQRLDPSEPNVAFGQAQPAADALQQELDAISQAIARVGARLREVNEHLLAVLSLSPDGFISFDEQQRISLASTAAPELIGWSGGELQGASAESLFSHLAAIAAAAEPIGELSRMNARPQDGPVTIELATRPPRTLSLLLNEGTHPRVRHVLYVRDITHMSVVDRLKSEFITLAAHELRTPMTSIFGFVELMMHCQMSDSKRHELMASVHRHCQQMIGILDDLVDLGRLEARGASDMQLESIDLRMLLRTAAHTFAVPDGRETPTLLSGERWPRAFVRGDPLQLARVFNNLLGNAYQYSPGGGPVEVRLELERKGEGTARCCVSITDHGLGMTPEVLARVGERFFRADGSGHTPGTGLGMSIVKEVLKLHRGELAIDSTPGQGTRVAIWLPLDGEAASAPTTVH